MSKFKFNKNAGYEFSSGERVGWLDAFADDYANQKSAVEVARERSQRSLYDQISSIVGGNTYASVESKVQDLQERVGLKKYLERISSEQKDTKKTAAGEFNDVFGNVNNDLKEQIARFVKNKINTYHGFISVLALQKEIVEIFKTQGIDSQDVNDPKVAQIIFNMIQQEKSKNPVQQNTDINLGRGVGVELEDDDNSNTDFFGSLMPSNQE